MAGNSSNNTNNDPSKYTSNQDIIAVDIPSLFNTYVTPIDQRRITSAGNFIESRCSAYYRIIGFPVTDEDGNFYSPGFDPNLNTDPNSRNANLGIDQSILGNKQLVSQQLDPRESLFKTYTQMFNSGGFNSIATVLGSMRTRAFDRQFTDGLGPLDFDSQQTQVVGDRYADLYNFYNRDANQLDSFNLLKNTGYLDSKHYLKPFINDPRNLQQINNISKAIAAPFLTDPNQLNVFPAGGQEIGVIKRPFIEQAIVVRFDNTNLLNSDDSFLNSQIATIISDIKNNSSNLNADQLALANNPQAALQNSDNNVFNSYVRLLEAIIDQLVSSIQDLLDIRMKINFQPLPETRGGIENGGSLADPVLGDVNNLGIEANILNLQTAVIKSNLSFQLNAGNSGTPDPNSFIFSNLGDTVYSPNKNQEKSFQDQLIQSQDMRNKLGSNGIADLTNIEMIMGEFSGLGIIDIVAIQAAFWLMSRSDLLGLLDQRAFLRAQQRTDLNFNGTTPTGSVLDALTGFEAALKNIYLIIQNYYDQKFNGQNYNNG